MNNNKLFSRKFLSVCTGISIVFLSMSLFVFSINSSTASEAMPAPSSPEVPNLQIGTAENFISFGINDGTAYWAVFNTADGCKFHSTPITALGKIAQINSFY